MIKSIIEFGPMLAFFVGYSYAGILLATQALLAATGAALLLQFILWRTISWNHIISAIILGLFGALTLYSGNAVFIKIKPTIIYGAFAIILGFGLAYDRVFVKSMLGHAAPQIGDKGWRSVTYLWIVFFIVAALANEFIWRNFSETTWVKFKVFGMIPLTLIFSIISALVLYNFHFEPRSSTNSRK